MHLEINPHELRLQTQTAIEAEAYRLTHAEQIAQAARENRINDLCKHIQRTFYAAAPTATQACRWKCTVFEFFDTSTNAEECHAAVERMLEVFRREGFTVMTERFESDEFVVNKSFPTGTRLIVSWAP